jgi:hypothetical protein
LYNPYRLAPLHDSINGFWTAQPHVEVLVCPRPVWKGGAIRGRISLKGIMGEIIAAVICIMAFAKCPSRIAGFTCVRKLISFLMQTSSVQSPFLAGSLLVTDLTDSPDRWGCTPPTLFPFPLPLAKTPTSPPPVLSCPGANSIFSVGNCDHTFIGALL